MPRRRTPGCTAVLSRMSLLSRHPQEARALLKCLGAQLGDFAQLLPGGKRAVFLPVGHDVLSRHGGETGHPAQERGEMAVFTSTPTALTQSSTTPSRASSSRFCGHIVLVLAQRQWPLARSSPAPPEDPGAAGQWTPQTAGSRHNCGNSSAARGLAEYTDAPASETII